MSHEFMDAQIFSPWYAMSRSLLAGDLGVYIKRKKGVVVASESELPQHFVVGDLPWVLSAAAAIRSCVHDVLRWAM